MDLYRNRMREKSADGIRAYGAPFKYIKAADYLSNQPKFGRKCNNVRAQSTGKAGPRRERSLSLPMKPSSADGEGA